MPALNERKFKTLVHYDPHLPDCHLVHRWGRADVQRLVQQTLRFDKKVTFMRDEYGIFARVEENEATEFTDDIRRWIIDLEHEVHKVDVELAMARVPPFLKTFINK